MSNTSHHLTNKRIGALILISNFLIAFIMLQHPQGLSNGHYPNTALKWVHGTLIFLFVFNAFGFGLLMKLCEANDRDSSLGLLFYYIGIVSLIGAALVSGFVQTSLHHSFSVNVEAFRYLNKFASILNQSLAKLGLVSLGAAGVFLAPALMLAQRGLYLVGIIGGAVGAILVVSTLMGLHYSVANVTILTTLVVVWHASIGVFLFRH